MANYRLFVEKNDDFAIERDRLASYIKDVLNISSFQEIRLFTLYDIVDIESEDYNALINGILVDPVMDKAYNNVDLIEGRSLAIEFVPGQFDQRSHSAMQALQLLADNAGRGRIKSAKLYYFPDAEFTDKEFNRIKKDLINPVESREKDLGIPPSLNFDTEIKPMRNIDGFTNASQDELLSLQKSLGMAMALEDLLFIQSYFKDEEQRQPSETELRLLDTYWSDHCRHTTFFTEITEVTFPDSALGRRIKQSHDQYLLLRESVHDDRLDDKPVCLMDMATIVAKDLRQRGLLNDLEVSEEINACSIRITVTTDEGKEPYLLMFKNETHNHPTEIEPFGGASTCLGGAIRDPLSGRAYVYQAMRITGSADPREAVEDTLPGKLPQRRITTAAAEGFSSYGNQIGLATTHVSEIYHPGYKAKRMEVGAVVGAVKEDFVRRESPLPGDVILLLGGRTGRDGIGGATGSSKGHESSSLETSGSEVQKGNAIEERKIQRLFRKAEVLKLIKKCNDFGAGGVSVAVGELADGLIINLDSIPLKYSGLNGMEIALSESQERMAIVVDAMDAQKFIALADIENLECTEIAVVTEEKRLIMKSGGEIIVSISRDFLDSNGVRRESKVHFPDQHLPAYTDQVLTKESWLTRLKNMNVASQQGLHEHFDSTIGGGTVLMPFGGKYQLSPQECSVQKIPVDGQESSTASAMAYGFDADLSSENTYYGASYAVLQSITKLVAVGCHWPNTRLSFQEYFQRLGNDSELWSLPYGALLGALFIQREFNIPAIGGKDSMSGSFEDIHVPPTLISFAVNTLDSNLVVSTELKKTDSFIYFLQHQPDHLGLPNTKQLKSLFDQYHLWVKEGLILAAATVGKGGLASTISKMSFGNRIGFHLDAVIPYLQPLSGSIIFESKAELDFPGLLKIGYTTEEEDLIINDIKMDMESALSAWTGVWEDIFPTKNTAEFDELPNWSSSSSPQNRVFKPQKKKSPKIIIPAFPGSNCEYDSQWAFEKAGGLAEIEVFRNRDKHQIKESIMALAKQIEYSQILMIPGGFSAGDEPDGSGKYISAVLQNERIQQSIMKLLERDGLVLGVCNGFQALIKSGLLPYGQFNQVNSESPTLAINKIGRHISQIVKTKVTNNHSPWLAGFDIGQTHDIAISHGEGRFVVSESIAKELIEKGQVATQYVDLNHDETLQRPHNPNGSMYAIEGITDYSGKIFGKMGHGERYGNNVYKNIPGNKYQGIFENGVKYFQ